MAETETAKIELSHDDAASSPLREIIDDLVFELTRRDLGAAIADYPGRIQSRISDALAMAGLQPDKVSAVFLKCGTTGMPSVCEAISEALPGAGIILGNAFGSVATGLALDAARRFGNN